MNQYLADILIQPESLRGALKKLDLSPIKPIREMLDGGKIDRIVLTGMGASLTGLYPAWIHLLKAGFAAIWLDSAELIYHTREVITDHSLVWVCSQSGRSAEVVRLLELLTARNARALLAITNEPESPLGAASANLSSGMTTGRLLMNAIPEQVPSTRTYMNTLAISELAAAALSFDSQENVGIIFDDLNRTADGLDSYLENWETKVEEFGEIVPSKKKDYPADHLKIALLGRGRSMASVLSGALCLQELARIPALGFESAQFRHGPLEVVDSSMTSLVFDGEPGSESSRLNRRIWQDMKKLGSRSWLLSSDDKFDKNGEVIRIPSYSGIGLPLAEIVPVQLLGYALCLKMGINAGEFRSIGKVTDRE